MNHIESRPSITAAHVYDFFVSIDEIGSSDEAIQALVQDVKKSGYGDVVVLSESATQKDFYLCRLMKMVNIQCIV